MESFVPTETLDHSISAKKILNSSASSNSIDLIYSITTSRIYVGTNILITDLGNSYFNPSGSRTFVFGGTSVATAGARYEFKYKTSFIEQALMTGDATLTSSDTARAFVLGPLCDQFIKFYDNCNPAWPANPWRTWEKLSEISYGTAENLVNMTGIASSITQAEWDYVANLQNVGINSSPSFRGLTILSGWGGSLDMSGQDIENCDEIIANTVTTDEVDASGDIDAGGAITSSSGDIIATVGDVQAQAGNFIGPSVRFQPSGGSVSIAEATTNWTQVLANNLGTVYVSVKHQTPVYSLTGWDSDDMSSHDVFASLKKTGSAAITPVLSAAWFFEYANVGISIPASDALMAFDLFIKVRVGSTIYLHRLDSAFNISGEGTWPADEVISRRYDSAYTITPKSTAINSSQYASGTFFDFDNTPEGPVSVIAKADGIAFIYNGLSTSEWSMFMTGRIHVMDT